jgi:hypothetical protein
MLEISFLGWLVTIVTPHVFYNIGLILLMVGLAAIVGLLIERL